MKVSVYIYNCACALAKSLIVEFIIQLMCSIRYILAHNGNIYACVLPLTRVDLLKFQETVGITGLRENSGRDGGIEEPYWGPSIAFARWSIFKIVSILEYLVIFRAVF